jgi:glycosyltransferase involved in cell wall biosynthesis
LRFRIRELTLIMRKTPVLHIVDTLRTGGAERMAVNLVNAMVDSPYAPHLCITRELGSLRDGIRPQVGLLHLNRKNRFDLVAFKRCLSYIRDHHIRLVHAHSTSVFFALLLGFCLSDLRVIWHVHGVDLQGMPFYKRRFYQWSARHASGIACASSELAKWVSGLRSGGTNIWYLSNFIPCPEDSLCGDRRNLPGGRDSRVICVSNLKNPKDHFTLLQAWKLVVKQRPNSHLLLVGGIGESEYAEVLFDLLRQPVFDGNVTWLGSRCDVSHLLRECEVGVLSSRSEGFPVSLLEYGYAKLGVVSTAVGQCAEILDQGKAGVLVPPGDPIALANALLTLLTNATARQSLAVRLFDHVSLNYSQNAVINRLFSIYAELIPIRSKDQ